MEELDNRANDFVNVLSDSVLNINANKIAVIKDILLTTIYSKVVAGKTPTKAVNDAVNETIKSIESKNNRRICINSLV